VTIFPSYNDGIRLNPSARPPPRPRPLSVPAQGSRPVRRRFQKNAATARLMASSADSKSSKFLRSSSTSKSASRLPDSCVRSINQLPTSTHCRTRAAPNHDTSDFSAPRLQTAASPNPAAVLGPVRGPRPMRRLSLPLVSATRFQASLYRQARFLPPKASRRLQALLASKASLAHPIGSCSPICRPMLNRRPAEEADCRSPAPRERQIGRSRVQDDRTAVPRLPGTRGAVCMHSAR
jgi:hypothetical protein